MSVVDSAGYQRMLAAARKGKYAYPAINVSSTETANAALLGFVQAKSDGIIQVSTGGAQFAAGQASKDMVLGAISLAEHVRRVAQKLDVQIALHTDHCHPDKVESFLLPLIAESERRVAKGEPVLFNSHMFDGSVLGLKENLEKSRALLERCARIGIILEVEIGVVGGEEDGHDTSGVGKEKLYTTPEDMVATHKALASVGPYLLAATFGNVHGVYKPGNVVLKPKILQEGQSAILAAFGGDAHALLVFHGGSGSELADIHETLDYGVIKMNIDTDTQYAFTRPVVDHMLRNYDAVLKVEGEVGDKKLYDPRAWGKKAEAGMAARVAQGAADLRSAGKSLGNAG